MEWRDRVVVGDVIYLMADECLVVENAVMGEYVVEEAYDSGGWSVRARKLTVHGGYVCNNLLVQFHQCPGYKNSLSKIRFIRCMTKIFI